MSEADLCHDGTCNGGYSRGNERGSCRAREVPERRLRISNSRSNRRVTAGVSGLTFWIQPKIQLVDDRTPLAPKKTSYEGERLAGKPPRAVIRALG